MSRKGKAVLCVLVTIIVLLSGFLAYILLGYGDWMVYTSYLQSPSELYNLEAGILYNALEFRAGEDYSIAYDFDHDEYPELLEKYRIEETAGNGSEYEKAMALMNAYSGRLHHASNYDNHVDMNALALLEYSLDNKSHGINCRSKAQILNEMCLALGLYARKVWIMPNSVFDNECHVVNEVWDTSLNQWVMLDITNNYYWVDESGKPLSILEIRDCIANQKFCTPVSPDDKLDNLERSLNSNYENFLYTAKNIVYTEYCTDNTVGETKNRYALVPVAYTPGFNERITLISKASIEASPFEQ